MARKHKTTRGNNPSTTKKINIMPDFSSSGVWEARRGGTMIDEDDLKEWGIPQSIIEELNYWVNVEYEKGFTKDYSFKKDPIIWKKINATGLDIATRIKKLFPKWTIKFVYEDFECLQYLTLKPIYFGKRK